MRNADPDSSFGETWLCLDFLCELSQLVDRDYLSIEQMDLAIGVLGKARIVRHHADGRALAMQIGQQVHHGLAVFRVQVARSEEHTSELQSRQYLVCRLL